MKRNWFMGLCTSVLLVCLTAIPASAVHIERLPESPDYDIVIEDAAQSFIDDVNKFAEESNYDVTITADNIDWNECYKRYADENDLLSDLSADCTLDELRQSLSYCWMVPVSADGYDISAEIKESSGHWYVDGIGFNKIESAEEIESSMDSSLDSDAELLYFSSLANLMSPVAFSTDEDTVVAQLLDEPQILSNDGSTLEQNTLYTFEELASALNPKEPNKAAVPITIVILCAVVCFIGLLIRHHRR